MLSDEDCRVDAKEDCWLLEVGELIGAFIFGLEVCCNRGNKSGLLSDGHLVRCSWLI